MGDSRDVCKPLQNTSLDLAPKVVVGCGRYAEHGRDLLQLEQHFDSWLGAAIDGSLPFPVIFMKASEAHHHTKAIAQFLVG